LLERLAELVARHATDGPRALARDPIFWTVIDRLHARRPRVAGARSGSPRTNGAPVKGPEPVRAPGEDEPTASSAVAEVAVGEETGTGDNAVESPVVAAYELPRDSNPEPNEVAARPAALDRDTRLAEAQPGETKSEEAGSGAAKLPETKSAEAKSGENG
jgi:hypothetical protein